MKYDRPNHGRFASDASTWELIEEIRTFRDHAIDPWLGAEANFLIQQLAFMEVSLASALAALARLEEQTEDQDNG